VPQHNHEKPQRKFSTARDVMAVCLEVLRKPRSDSLPERPRGEPIALGDDREDSNGGGSGHVAIVDDDASVRKSLARLLRTLGIECRSYASARAFLRAGIPDCLILDVNMPDMTGLELQRELLNRGVRIPTIVITAREGKGVAASAASLGAVAFFHKPVPRDALMAAISSAKAQHHVHVRNDFDRSGIVVDWLEACRSNHLTTLLDLYEERATLTCVCDGVDLAGRNSIAAYLKTKLENKVASAFRLDGMMLAGDEVQIDCQGCRGKPVRIHFRFSPLGKLLHTKFGPLPCAACAP
jgi:CheY-like chemotaxis protein